MSVARWKPSEYALGDHAELVVTNQCSCADFRAKVWLCGSHTYSRKYAQTDEVGEMAVWYGILPSP